jgi:hypothetical protein
MRLLVRTIGIARSQVTTGRANPACHVTHLARLGTRTAPASSHSAHEERHRRPKSDPAVSPELRHDLKQRSCS